MSKWRENPDAGRGKLPLIPSGETIAGNAAGRPKKDDRCDSGLKSGAEVEGTREVTKSAAPWTGQGSIGIMRMRGGLMGRPVMGSSGTSNLMEKKMSLSSTRMISRNRSWLVLAL